jgi:hypothetical protein
MCNDAHIKANQNYPNWLALVNNQIDLRAVYVSCVKNAATPGTSYQTISSITWPDYTQVVDTRS